MSPAQNDPIFALSHDFVNAYAVVSPVQASMAGVPGQWDGWDDWSPEGGERVSAFLNDYRARLLALPNATDRWGRLARRVMLEFLDEKAQYYEFSENLCDLNNVESPLQHMRVVFDAMDTTGREGFQALAKRLETIDVALLSYRAALEEGVRRGIVAARRQVRAATVQARMHASDKSSFLALLESYDAAGVGDAELRGRIVRGIDHARAAYASLAVESQTKASSVRRPAHR